MPAQSSESMCVCAVILLSYSHSNSFSQQKH